MFGGEAPLLSQASSFTSLKSTVAHLWPLK